MIECTKLKYHLLTHTRSGVGSAKANCGDFNNAQYAAFEPYLIEERGSKSFYSNVASAGNKIPDPSLATVTNKVSFICLKSTKIGDPLS